jgi:hypothetical protein
LAGKNGFALQAFGAISLFDDDASDFAKAGNVVVVGVRKLPARAAGRPGALHHQMGLGHAA